MDEKIVPIASIDSQQDGHTFTVEAKITFPTDLNKFYVLVCSNCGQDVRYPTIRQINCMNCDQENLLVPRCRFDVDLWDDWRSTIGIILDKEEEKLLSLTTEEIYKRPSDPGNYPSLEDVQANISNKLFHVQAKKAFARALRTTSVKLCIHSCVEKQCFAHSVPSLSTINIHEPSKRKQKVDPPHITEEAGSLKMKQKLDPATPKKNNWRENDYWLFAFYINASKTFYMKCSENILAYTREEHCRRHIHVSC